MNALPIESLIRLRLAVGYLGEQHQAAWWQSSFLSSAGRTFLIHSFAKTLPLARYSGVTAAAARVHDERIGVGQHVYHLFRLPEALEQAAFRAMHDAELVAQIVPVIADRDAALAHLTAGAGRVSSGGAAEGIVGPTWVATTQDVYGDAAWGRVAALYLHGFGSGERVYPYFSDRSP